MQRMSISNTEDTSEPTGVAGALLGREPSRVSMQETDTTTSQPESSRGTIGATDERIQQAANENFWGPQPARQALMLEFQTQPPEQRRQIFEDAMTRGLQEEGISGNDAEYWKNAMRELSLGEGLPRGKHGENPDMNPYIIAGESGGVPGTADRANSTALGYFQFLHQDGKGNPYSHEQYRPDEYKSNPYDPVGQVRQFIRAIKAGKHKGDPMGAVNEKIRNANGSWGP